MLFRIRHTTRFQYDQAASESHNEVRMRPLDGPGQRCVEFALDVYPGSSALEYDDYYGNRVQAVSVDQPHDALVIEARSLVERVPEAEAAGATVTFREFLAHDSARQRDEYDFLSPSQFVPFSQSMRKFFWIAHPANDEDVAEYTEGIVRFVRDQFEYEPGLTGVHSSADEILSVGGGVCQDFAHLTIGLLRLAGVPARYVSGYLAPWPNSSGELPVGTRATHAWLEAQLPGLGWIGFDPTHGCRADCRYIRVAIGRDYADVPPFKGVFRSAGAKQMMTVELDIESTNPVESGGPSGPDQSQSQQ